MNLNKINDYFVPEIMSDKHVALAVMFDVPAGEDYRFDQICPFSQMPDPKITNDLKSVVSRARRNKT